MQNIQQLLTFIVEIEKLKGVERKTRPVGLQRLENSAEHSWHVCLAALVLQEYANEPVDIQRVLKMLLIHDLGEVDAGDVIVYAAETAAQKAREAEGVKRVLGLLPESQAEHYLELWQEFEKGETAEAKYAKAIDRLPPLLHNLHGEGHSWKEHRISKERVFGLNSRISEGSNALWQALQPMLQQAVEDGHLK